MQSTYFEAVSSADVDARVQFIRRTYAHLMGAIVAFVILEVALFQTSLPGYMTELMTSGPYSWLIVLGLFMGVGWLANWWAMQDTSPLLQYAGLGLYVVVEAIIFVPLLFMATYYSSPEVLPSAAITTAVVFSGLTVSVFVTKKDFSFMRSGLMIASFLAMGGIGAAIVFGFNLGLFFSIAMAGLAAGYVLYYTSNVLHHYRTDQHVAAALALFSAVALLFWYILRIFMSRD